jgi:UrcA family protein
MKNTSKTSTLFKLIAISLITAFGSGVGTLATAAPTGDEPLTATVKYSDLDLSQAAGVSQLYGRIRRAAETVCSPLEGTGVAAAHNWAQCVDQAVTRAVASVNRPALAALHAAKSGKQQPTRIASMSK